MITVTTPYPQFAELDGSPLDNGAVYIGTAGLNSETNPIAVFWDNAGTQPAAQPLTTRSGIIARNGAPARVYVNAAAYSLLVKDKQGRLIAYEAAISSAVGTDNIDNGSITEVKLATSVKDKLNGALQRTGGTMTGAIVLAGNAANALEAVPRQQAESIAASAAASAVANRMQYSLLAAASTGSGPSVDVTSIPAWATRITVLLNGVSTNGTFNPLFQLGSGSYATSGYAGSQTLLTTGAATSSLSGGFSVGGSGAVSSRCGSFVFTHQGSNAWVCSGSIGFADSPGVSICGGVITLAGTLDRLRLFAGGTDQFDGGGIRVLIEG